MKIGVVQMNVIMDKDANLGYIESSIDKLARSGCDLIALPENCMFLSADPGRHHAAAEPVDGPFVRTIRAAAKARAVNVHVGSIIESRGKEYFNTAIAISRDGGVVGTYSKIHRFDVDLPDGTAIRESDLVSGGHDVVVVELDGVKLGLSTCYDVRFPELYRRLVDLGAEVIMVPAAFTFQTGADHWEVLLRARAIEAQAYIVAAGQVGSFDGRNVNFGHSMVVDPWGLVVGQCSNRPATTMVEIDVDYVHAVRSRMPVRRHRVLKS